MQSPGSERVRRVLPECRRALTGSVELRFAVPMEAATGPGDTGDTIETIRRLARHRPEITLAYLLARSAPNHGFGMDREKRSLL
jgi:hypothetical protein